MGGGGCWAGGIPYITPSTVLHTYLRILLTFNRNQVMHSVVCIVLCVEVAYKGIFLIQKQIEN